MAYDKQELIDKALEAIEKHNLFFISDVIAFMPCSSATFYNHELEKIEDIKSAIEKNRVSIKVNMRKKWFESDHPTLQVALMKIISSDEEAHRLNGSRQEIKHEGDIKSTIIEWKPADKEEQ
jgi:hypothetical protein